DEAGLSRTPDRHFDHHRHQPGVSAQTLWGGERLLFSARLSLCRSAISGEAASATGGSRRDRILAEFSADGAWIRSAYRRGQGPYLRPVLIRLPALAPPHRAGFRTCGPLPVADE